MSKPLRAGLLTIFLSLIFQTACGGGSGSTQISTSSPPPASRPEFLYQISFTNGIQVSTLDTTSGSISNPIQAIPFNDFENQGVPIVVTPSGAFLYEQGF